MEKKTTFWALFILALAVGGLIGMNFFRGSSSGSGAPSFTGEATSSLGDACVFVDHYDSTFRVPPGTELNNVCDKINTLFTRYKYKTVNYGVLRNNAYFTGNNCSFPSFSFGEGVSMTEKPNYRHDGKTFGTTYSSSCSFNGGDYYSTQDTIYYGVLCCK